MKGGILFENDCLLVKDKIYAERGQEYFMKVEGRNVIICMTLGKL